MHILKALIILLLTVSALIYFGQRVLVFPAPDVSLPSSLPDDIEFVSLSEGYGLLLAPTTQTTSPAPLLIYTHGNAAAALWFTRYVKPLQDAGFYVLLLEYPGYADAPGRPSLHSMERSALEAYDQLVARSEIDAERIVAYGRSIGGGVATLIARQRPLAALGLESSFTTLSEVAAHHGYPSFLLRDRFDNAAIVKTLKLPIYLFHGTTDRIIPFHHTETLAQLAVNSEFNQADCGHNDCPEPWLQLLKFLRHHNII